MKINIESIGFLQILTIVFIILKLIGKITWSWWWVLSPFWIPISIFTIFLLIGIIYNFSL